MLQFPLNFILFIYYVTAEQFSAMNDKWTEQFAHFDAILTRGSVFSTPKSLSSHVILNQSNQTPPFIAPATRPTGLEETPVDQDVVTKGEKATKEKHKRVTEKNKTSTIISRFNLSVWREAVAGIGFSDVPISNCMNYATYCLIRITIGVFYNIYTPFQQFGVLISLILP